MDNAWILWTQGDPLKRVQQFLYDVWRQASLEFILVNIDSEDLLFPTPSVVAEPQLFALADPFTPFLSSETIPLITELASSPERPRFAAVVRPCEARALRHLAASHHIRLNNILLIACECIGAYAPDDYAWRRSRAGSTRELVMEVLRNARQGGISLDRFRNACQFCQSPIDTQADLTIHVYGLPVKELLLVSAASEALAAHLGLHQITDDTPRPQLMDQHLHILNLAHNRRAKIEKRSIDELPATLFADLPHLMAHLVNCTPCRACLEACPNYVEDWAPSLDTTDFPIVERWLESCAACGLCEDACPNHLPLLSLFKRVHQSLEHSPLPG